MQPLIQCSVKTFFRILYIVGCFACCSVGGDDRKADELRAGSAKEK